MARLAKIYWRDIQAISTQWRTIEEAKLDGRSSFNLLHHTIGYIIEKNKNFLLVAGSYDGKEHYNDISMIMRSVITKIVFLK